MLNLKQNPLTSQIAYLNGEQRTILASLVKEKATSHGGVAPSHISFIPVSRDNTQYGRERRRDHLVAIWNDIDLTEHQVTQLEKVIVDAHSPNDVELRRKRDGSIRQPRMYKTTSSGVLTSTRGYLISDEPYDNNGLFVFRKFGSKSEARRLLRKERGKWLYNGQGFVELRLPLEQTNLSALEQTTRISQVLGRETRTDQKKMLYDLYRSLMLAHIEQTKSDELAGLEEIIDFVRWTMFGASVNPNVSAAYGLRNRSVMLAGVYGVGKTTVAKVMATENNNALFVPIEASTLVQSLFEKENEVGSLFESVTELQKRTGVDVALFCDDIESAMIDPKNSDVRPEYLAGTSSLLNKLQGVGGGNTLLNGSTNNPFVIDPRFLEFGRVGYIVHVPLPDLKGRILTFEIHSKKLLRKNINFQRLGEQTDGFNNRSIEEICHKAGESAARRVANKIKKPGESVFSALKRVTSEMTNEFPIVHEDYEEGLRIVSRHVRTVEIKKLDDEIGKFCTEYNGRVIEGFRPKN